MPQFIVFAVATTMCVLCFAVGFIAALVLRIAQHNAAPTTGAAAGVQNPAPPDIALERPAYASRPSAPVPSRSISLSQAETDEQREAAIPPAATGHVQPVPHLVRSGGFPAPMAPPPAKVFLFGDPHLEAVVVPTRPPVPSTPPAHGWTPKPHVSPQRLAAAEIDLLPRRPQHARAARRR